DCDPLLRLAAVALSRAVRRPGPRARRRERLCDHPRRDVPAVRLSRAVEPRRRLQLRSHVRLLTGAAGYCSDIPALRRPTKSVASARARISGFANQFDFLTLATL